MTNQLTNPSVWLEQEVMPVINKFLANPLSVADARLAIYDVNDFPERVYRYCKEEMPEYLEGKNVDRAIADARRSTPILELVERVASASKHHLIQRKNINWSSSGQFSETTEAVWICDETGSATYTAGAVLLLAVEQWRQWLADHPGT